MHHIHNPNKYKASNAIPLVAWFDDTFASEFETLQQDIVRRIQSEINETNRRLQCHGLHVGAWEIGYDGDDFCANKVQLRMYPKPLPNPVDS